MPPQAKNKPPDLIIGRSLIVSETIASELRERLVNRLARKVNTLDQTSLLQIARQILNEFEPMLADTLFDAEIAAWVAGVQFVADKTPAPRLMEIGGGDKGPPFSVTTLLYGDEGEPVVRFPMIERAAQVLAKKKIVSKEEFEALSAGARANAFTVAGANSDATIEKIRDTLVDLVREGPTLRDFKERLAADLETSAIGPGHAELIYRNTVQTAYMNGHDDMAANPVVRTVFPYQEYLCIHDGRCRPEHRALERLGLSGGNVYRVDDPFWDLFTPPWDFNCRCGVNLMTREAAARKGVAEAAEWIKTGAKPQLSSRLDSIPFRPPAGWSTRRSVTA